MGEARLGRLFAAIGLSSVLAPLNSTMLAVAIPSISRELEEDVGLVTHALVTSYLVGSIALQGPGGRLGDRIGHRRALSIGQVIFVVGAVAGYLAQGLVALVSARILMSIGGAIIVPCASALLRTELPPERRGRAFGAFGGMMGLSATVGPLLGGALEPRFGFRSLFLVNAPVLVLSALLAAGTSPSRAPAAGRAPAGSFDALGSALLAASIALVVVGAKLPRGAAATTGAGVLTFALLLAHERRVARPLLDPDLLRRPVFAAGASVLALSNLVMYSMLFLLPGVWSREHQLGASAAGRLLMPMMVAMVLSSPLAGRLTDALGARVVALVGGATCLVGLVSVRLAAGSTPGAMAWAMAIVGCGVGLSGSPAQAAAMSAAPAERSGLGAGLLATARYLGGVLGMLALGALAHAGPIVEPGRELRVAAGWFTVAAALSIGASLWLPGRAAPTPAAVTAR